MQINQITIAGNAGKDAVRVETGQTSFVSFSLAHSEKHKDTGQETTTWVDVLTFGNWAKEAIHVRKGDNVIVTGKLSVRDTESRDGKKYRNVSVLTQSIGRIQRAEPQPSAPVPSDTFVNTPASTFNPDEIPF